MLTITKVADDRLDITLSGALDSIEMATALDRLIAESREITNGKMLYRIYDFEMPTLGALAVEFGRLPSLFGMLRSFDRCAVLCDAAWLRQMAELEGVMLPGLEIRGFAPDAEAAAVRWLDHGDVDFDDVPV